MKTEEFIKRFYKKQLDLQIPLLKPPPSSERWKVDCVKIFIKEAIHLEKKQKDGNKESKWKSTQK